MKKILFSVFAAVMAIGFTGCEYDDSELVGRVDNLEQRVLTLEQLCQQMNTNITAMQAIVNALQTQDAITSVTPITEGSKAIGYTITFAKGEPITIYHGQDGKNGADGEDGKDGYTPVIGVDQDEDGVYYWTLDGEWLTDAEGNKIPATGKDGKDGEDGDDAAAVMPELKIQGGYWYISYDSGENWERLGRATGYDGSDGDAFFQSVKVYSDFVEFKLSDGTVFYVPKHVALEVVVKEALMDAKVLPGEEFVVNFEFKNAGNNADGVNYVVISDYPTIDEKTGNIVTVRGDVPANAQQGDEIEVTLLATKDGKSVMASHTFTVSGTGVSSLDDLKTAFAEGGNVVLLDDIEFEKITNVEPGADVHLNLNGKTITVDENTKSNTLIWVKEGAKLTIDGNGTIDLGSVSTMAIFCPYGELVIENGTFIRDEVKTVTNATTGLFMGAKITASNVTINGGYFDPGYYDKNAAEIEDILDGTKNFAETADDIAKRGNSGDKNLVRVAVKDNVSVILNHSGYGSFKVYGGTFVGANPAWGDEGCMLPTTPNYLRPWSYYQGALLAGQTFNENGLVIPDGYNITKSVHEDGRPIYTVNYSK